MLRRLLAGTAMGLIVAGAASAQAATLSVTMGPPSRALGKLNGDANDFFPHVLAVNVGAKVKFVNLGFHTLNIPAKGDGPLPLFLPGDPVAGAKDAAGADFWFNGQPSQGFNPALFASGFGKTFSYNGKKGIESGLPLAPKIKPLTVKFTKKGRYVYFCDVHPGMTGVIKVLPRKAKTPSRKSVARKVGKQVKRDLKILRKVNRFEPATDTIQIGGAGRHGVESYNFFPADSTVKAGTTVTFDMPVGSTEPHTATTGPGHPDSEPDSYLGKLSKSFEAPAPDPIALYPSDFPGAGPASFGPSLHGNGFWNTGVLDSIAASPLPMSSQVTFSTPGDYMFHCLIHPFMKTMVTVTS